MRVGIRRSLPPSPDDTPVERPYKTELRLLRDRIEHVAFLTYIALAIGGGLLLGVLVAAVLGIVRR